MILFVIKNAIYDKTTLLLLQGHTYLAHCHDLTAASGFVSSKVLKKIIKYAVFVNVATTLTTVLCIDSVSQ